MRCFNLLEKKFGVKFNGVNGNDLLTYLKEVDGYENIDFSYDNPDLFYVEVHSKYLSLFTDILVVDSIFSDTTIPDISASYYDSYYQKKKIKYFNSVDDAVKSRRKSLTLVCSFSKQKNSFIDLFYLIHEIVMPNNINLDVYCYNPETYKKDLVIKFKNGSINYSFGNFIEVYNDVEFIKSMIKLGFRCGNDNIYRFIDVFSVVYGSDNGVNNIRKRADLIKKMLDSNYIDAEIYDFSLDLLEIEFPYLVDTYKNNLNELLTIFVNYYSEKDIIKYYTKFNI